MKKAVKIEKGIIKKYQREMKKKEKRMEKEKSNKQVMPQRYLICQKRGKSRRLASTRYVKL